MTPDALPVPLILVSVRLWALLRVAPAWRVVVGPWWNVVAAGLAIALALVIAPSLDAPLAASFTELAALVVLELVVGTLLGLLAALPAFALLGASAGSAVIVRSLPGPWVALTAALVLATGLSLGIHHPLLTAALDTFTWLPLAEPTAAPLRLEHLTAAAHTLLVLALALVTPALLAGLVLELVTRLVGRGPGPAAAATDVAPWFRLAAALIALGVSWSVYAPAWTRALLPA